MRWGVVVFPGSNCDHDCYHVIRHVLGQPVDFVWHKTTVLSDYDCLVLPGGFSYGDYLRTGAIARFSPVMSEVVNFAQKGGLVLGICNGFQILLEAGLLPGAMQRNQGLKFICRYVNLRVENNLTPFTQTCRSGQVLQIPIAHMEGNYYADEQTLAGLNANNQIVFRYSSPQGEVGAADNPNGSLENIAGICNRARNVMGLMPHPERCSESVLGGEDGKLIFSSVLKWWQGK
ncbi:MAG: phosphoribosylformylglycinamidine synthase subunit PurQ, partial [Candidatus Schekmanbacteria bacterium]|nr:phosphoribosylformylglycinamidine synthase subunit PurQ [Candidatus Schekmanbacteria bacterium]